MVRCLEGLFCPAKILQFENHTSFYNCIFSFLLGAWQALRSWKVVAKQPRGNGYWLVPMCLSTFVFSLIYLATGNENLEREEQVSYHRHPSQEALRKFMAMNGEKNG